jgi:hypothetical protein
MAFATRLIAISRSLGEYSVLSQFDGHVKDDIKLRRSGRSIEVSDCPGYADFAVILSREEFPKFIGPESPTAAWFASLPPSIFFIIVVFEDFD